MGIPKFFRWIAERYPCVLTPYQDQFFPPIDNLYLDMNGLIHPCTHPNDFDPSQKSASEKDMAVAIFQYVEKLFQRIKPRKHFVMCVDGCAPRAKMNQQRQRRFRSADDMRKGRQLALERGETIPDEAEVFDTNAITPGTEFMCRLSRHLKYFVEYKIQTDILWQHCTVIFSGQEVPGEGEHKIMEFIRNRKCHPDYSPNETHCLYGLDADLIMLALVSHEPHFILLREEVDFGKSRNEKEKEEEFKTKGLLEDRGGHKRSDRFQCLHMCMVREYLMMEFQMIDPKAAPTAHKQNKEDFERIIDDFVFMCFFVGNDFLPPLPLMDIRENALDVLFRLYREHFVQKKRFITDKGVPDWSMVGILLQAIGVYEKELVEQADEQKKQLGIKPMDYREVYYRGKFGMEDWSSSSTELRKLKQAYLEGLYWTVTYYYQGVQSWKWYFPYHYGPMAGDLGIDTAELGRLIKFDKGKPFLPFQQLLGVLPPASFRLLPSAFHPLLVSATSPISDFYPTTIEVDREEKQAEWEGVVKIPFIDEDRLVKAYGTVLNQLTPAQSENNKHGEALVYSMGGSHERHALNSTLDGLPNLKTTQVRVQPVSKFPYLCPLIEDGKVVPFHPRPVEKERMGPEGVEGFPTFFTKPQIEWKMEAVGVNLFGLPSRKESLVVKTPDACFEEESKEIPDVSAKTFSRLLGSEVWVGWPYVRRAEVLAMADVNESSGYLFNRSPREIQEWHEHSDDEKAQFRREAEYHRFMIKQRMGLQLGTVQILVYVKWLLGITRDREGRASYMWSDSLAAYPLQLVTPAHASSQGSLAYNPLKDSRFAITQISEDAADWVLSLRDPYYGHAGKVQSRDGDGTHDLSIFDIDLSLKNPPPLLMAYQDQGEWLTLAQVAEHLGQSTKTIAVITSSISVDKKICDRELGLSLKLSGRNLCRLGYARKFNRRGARKTWVQADIAHHFSLQSKKERETLMKDNNQAFQAPDTVFAAESSRRPYEEWNFSPAAVEMIKAYMQTFPQVLHALRQSTEAHTLDPRHLCTGAWEKHTEAECTKCVADWLAAQPSSKAPLVDANELALPPEAIKQLERHMITQNEQEAHQDAAPYKIVGAKYRKWEVFPPYFKVFDHRRIVVVPTAVPPTQRTGMTLGARVVYANSNGVQALGAVGTVLRVLGDGMHVEVMFDKENMMCNRLNGRLTTQRGALLDVRCLIVASGRGGAGQSGSRAGTPTHAKKDPSVWAALGSPLPLINTPAGFEMETDDDEEKEERAEKAKEQKATAQTPTTPATPTPAPAAAAAAAAPAAPAVKKEPLPTPLPTAQPATTAPPAQGQQAERHAAPRALPTAPVAPSAPAGTAVLSQPATTIAPLPTAPVPLVTATATTPAGGLDLSSIFSKAFVNALNSGK